jgi:hypothetical protein
LSTRTAASVRQPRLDRSRADGTVRLSDVVHGHAADQRGWRHVDVDAFLHE